MVDHKGEVLPECQPSFTDMRITVGRLEYDVAMNVKVIDKISEAVEKIEEMNANLVKMIAVHDLKHENAEEDIKELSQRLDSIRSTTTTTTISTTEEESKKTLDQLKKWKYMIIGGALVIGWIVAHIKWSILVTLFGG